MDGERACAPAFASGRRACGGIIADLVQKLTLTPDQQKRMDDILQQSRLQLIDLRANVEKQELLMEPMLAANPPDTNKILAQIDHTAQARAELEKANAKMLLGIRNVLTPDQWTKLQAEERDNRRMRPCRVARADLVERVGRQVPVGTREYVTRPAKARSVSLSQADPRGFWRVPPFPSLAINPLLLAICGESLPAIWANKGVTAKFGQTNRLAPEGGFPLRG